MMKKLISAAIALVLALSCISVSAANVFSDVTQANYSWAVNEIEEMASMGIIKGYSDSIFAPADDVTKIQSLLLCARILGYADEDNKAFNELAADVYGDIVREYPIQYVDEVCFLLYKGVLDTDELPGYIGGDNADAPLKRYEAAVLMTKVMGAEDEAESMSNSTRFTDSADIPASAKPYVNYVSSISLMLGMERTATVNNFVPLFNVNRAQMAVLLYRMMNLMGQTIEYGTVDSVEPATYTIMFTDADGITSGVNVPARLEIPIRVDGYVSSLDKIKPQSIIAIVRKGDTIVGIETITVIGDETYRGIVNGISTSNGKRSITLHAVNDKEQIKYPLASDVSVIYNGAPAVLSSVKSSDYVELDIKDGEVIVISATDKEKTVVGTVTDIVLGNELLICVQTANGDVEEYTVIDDATATRNGKTAAVNEILIGDKVTLTIRYDMIAKVVATSSKSTVTGTIEEILIATQPTIKVRESGGAYVYSISRDASYVIDGSASDIYDLRLGSSVTLNIEGETAVKVSSTAPTTTNVLTGTVNTVNPSYGFILLDTVAANGEVTQTQVFMKKSGIKIIDSSTGKEVSASSIKQGAMLSITGVMNTGAFEATTIIILP